MQWTSEATRPSHHGSSITASAAQRSEATRLSGRTLCGHGQLKRRQHAPGLRPPASLSSQFPAGGLAGRPLLPCSAELAVASRPGKVAVPRPLCSRNLGRPGAVQQPAGFLSALLQTLQRKLPTPLALLKLGLRQRPPARRPQLLPRRPVFVLLPHPALEPGRNSRISRRAWGLRAPGPYQDRAGGTRGCLHAIEPLLWAFHDLDCRLRSPARPRRLALRALESRRGSQPPGRRGPPSVAGGIGGRASRMRRRPPHLAGLGVGNCSLSFAGAGCVSCQLSFPVSVESFLSPWLRLPGSPGHPAGLTRERWVRGSTGARHS